MVCSFNQKRNDPGVSLGQLILFSSGAGEVTELKGEEKTTEEPTGEICERIQRQQPSKSTIATQWE